MQQGFSNKLIARKLNIAESTVKIYVGELFRHYGATNRCQLGIYSLQGKTVVLPNIEDKPFAWVKMKSKKVEGIIFCNAQPSEEWMPLYLKEKK